MMARVCALAALGFCGFLTRPACAWAKQELREMYGAAYSVAVDPRIALTGLAPDDPQSVGFAGLMPPDTASLDVLRIGWPKSKHYMLLAVARPGASGSAFAASAYGGSGQASCTVAVQVGDQAPRSVNLPAAMTVGALSRLCVWPDQQGELVLLLSFAGWEDDATVCCIRVNAEGSALVVDCGGARTLYGWFDVVDVDDDGRFELITRRNLDGQPGGFFYRSIRAYDAGSASYSPAPEAYSAWFQGELAWLDWVLATREAIQADPAAFESQDPAGPRYLAEYEGQLYSFDTVINLPGAPSHAATDQALGYIRTYRNELAAWLGGGPKPGTWKLPR